MRWCEIARLTGVDTSALVITVIRLLTKPQWQWDMDGVLKLLFAWNALMLQGDTILTCADIITLADRAPPNWEVVWLYAKIKTWTCDNLCMLMDAYRTKADNRSGADWVQICERSASGRR